MAEPLVGSKVIATTGAEPAAGGRLSDHARGQSRGLVAKPAKMLPAERPPPPGGHAIYAGSGRIGLAGSDHKARRARIRRLAKPLATDRRRQFVKVQIAN